MSGLLDSVEAPAGLAVFGAAEVPEASAARATLGSSGAPGLLAVRDRARSGPAARGRLVDVAQDPRDRPALRVPHGVAGVAQLLNILQN